MGDDPYSQSSDHRLFHSLSSRNPVIRRPDGVINGTRRGYKRPARRGRINDKMPDGVSLFRYPTGYRKHATPGGVINDLPGGVINDLHTDIRRGIAFHNLNGGEGIAFRLHATPSKGYKGSCTTGSTSYTDQVSLRRRAMRGKNAGFTCETKLLVGGVGVEP